MTQYLSDQGPVIGGLLPIEMQGRVKKQVSQKGNTWYTYYCEVIVKVDSDGTPVGCPSQRATNCGNMCIRHRKETNKIIYGESITPTDDHIRENQKSSAKTVYDELVSKFYNNDAIDNDDEYDDTGDDSELFIWINAESKSQQMTVIAKLLTELKERVKNVKFLTTIEGKWYEMKENEVYAKLKACFKKKDYTKNFPDGARFVPHEAINKQAIIFERVPLDKNNVGDDDFLKSLLNFPELRNISISTSFDYPDVNHEYAVKDGNGEYNWDLEIVPKQQKRKQFRKEHIEQAIQKRVTEECASSFPSYVYNIQFLYRGIWYRMFLKISGGKFVLYYNVAVPYNGTKFLRLKKAPLSYELDITEITFPHLRGNYPMVGAPKAPMRFKAHRMVLYLWGGPNNAWDGFWEQIDSLEGDHIENDLYNWCIWYLQWLTGGQNTDKERKH